MLTADPQVGLYIAKRIRTGTFLVNGVSPGFDMPFGGYKKSGVGREFGKSGIEVYTEQKSIGY